MIQHHCIGLQHNKPTSADIRVRARAPVAAAARPNSSSSLLLMSWPFFALLAYPRDERVEAGEKSLLLCDILGDAGLAASNGLGYRGDPARGTGDGPRACCLICLICVISLSFLSCSLPFSRFSLCSSRHLRLWDLLNPGGVFGMTCWGFLIDGSYDI